MITARPHALVSVSSDMTRNTFTANSGHIVKAYPPTGCEISCLLQVRQYSGYWCKLSNTPSLLHRVTLVGKHKVCTALVSTN